VKFSILLPTRNRLEYLKFAVESVRRQDYDNWEIIVSDNCSEDDIKGFVDQLDDSRVHYVRTSTFVPVTDNWNNALEHSNGDYVVMLGDDDGLMPGYFSTLLKAFEDYPDPDFVYVSALFYAYPGVMPNQPAGFLRRDRNGYFSHNAPFWLEQATAREIAQGYLDFRMPVASNMQFSLISRRKIKELSVNGKFFHSPYPDFYATPMLFMASERILVHPDPLVVIGITPKSYGFFHFNNQAGAGVNFLNNSAQLETHEEARSFMLPGTSYNDSWLLANFALYENQAKARGLEWAVGNYRRLQIVHGFKHRYYDRTIGGSELDMLTSKMTLREKLRYGLALRSGFTLLRAFPEKWRAAVVARLRKVIGQHAMSNELKTSGQMGNLVDVYEAVASGRVVV
jgi:glycosyltransferase involved in cell wall biosynthesis